MQETGVRIPVVGMTKREEEIVVFQPEVRSDPADRGQPDEGGLMGAKSVKPKRSAAHGSLAVRIGDTATQIKRDGNFAIVRLPRGSQALFLVQRIRDEAHRFAITYHRKLRGKDFLQK
jgi:excinuclease UvrABC nuclease subunit